MITLTLEGSDKALGVARDYIAQMSDRRQLHAEMGMAVETKILRHIREVKLPQGNRLNAPSTGFWQKALASVKSTFNHNSAIISIPYRGVALQYYGGRVEPKRKEWLTIPIHADAHGKSVAEIKQPLYKFLSRKGNWILATDPNPPKKGKPRKEKKTRKRGEPMHYRGGTPLYVLKKEVNIGKHPDVLPDERVLNETAAKAAIAYVGRRLHG